MGDPISESCSSSDVVTLEYESTLSAGLDISQYYLSQSVRDSTKRQVLLHVASVTSHLFITCLCFFSTIVSMIFWLFFFQENGIPKFGADHKQLAACLSLVMLRDGSYSKVVMLSSAIAHEHRFWMLPSPTLNEKISLLFRGFRNEPPQMRTPKSPITEDILSKMFHLYRPVNGRDGLCASLVLWRTVWRVSIEYHTLCRFSDIVKLQRKHVIYKSSPSPHLQILFQGGKNDQYSEGSKRIVASNINEEICPVKLTLNYFQFLGPSYSGCLVFLCTAKNVPNPVKPVPYSSALSDLKKLLQSFGCDPKLYGEHSGKRGGATESQLKRLGGWRSDVMPSKYVDLSLPSRISMSQLLQKNSQ